MLPPNVVATYGMTETGSGVVYDGWPLDGVEVAFRSPDRTPTGGRRRSADAEGEILIRAPMLFRCYRDGRRRAGRRTRRRARTGSPPATPVASTPTGRSSCPAASPTSSPPAPRRSGPIRSNASSWRTRAWPRSRSGSGPIPNGASGWWPGSSRPTTRPSLDELRQMVAETHRPLGGPEGARPRRRPSPHRGGQGPPAGARDLRVPGGTAAQSRSLGGAVGQPGTEARELVRVRHHPDADDGPVHDVEHERRHDRAAVHEDGGRLPVEHGGAAGRPATSWRRAAGTASCGTGRPPAAWPRAPCRRRRSRRRRPRTASRGARQVAGGAGHEEAVGQRAPWRRSASKRWRRSSIRLRARAPSWRQAAGRPPERAAPPRRRSSRRCRGAGRRRARAA